MKLLLIISLLMTLNCASEDVNKTYTDEEINNAIGVPAPKVEDDRNWSKPVPKKVIKKKQKTKKNKVNVA